MNGSVAQDNAQIVSMFEQKGSKRSLLSRSLSDSAAGVLQGSIVPKSHFEHSFDDNDIEQAENTKPASVMASSNSLPNLAALNTEPPDVSEWADFDLPFDMYESFGTESLENAGEGIDPFNSQNSPTNTNDTLKRKNSKLEVGIADKSHFFHSEQLAEPPSKSPSMRPLPLSPKLQPAAMEDRMQPNSSGSMDSRDSMRDLAKKVTPVNRNGVEFAPLDLNQLPSMSGSYSMSVDESVLLQHDTSMNQQGGSDKKAGGFELPESFSMSSWSQHSISVDMFAPHNLPAPGFSRDNLLLGRRQNSDQSITEKMLDEENWDAENFDLPLDADAHAAPRGSGVGVAGGAQLTQQALRQHQGQQQRQQQGQAAGRGGAGRGGAGHAAAVPAGRGGRAAISRGVKLNSTGVAEDYGMMKSDTTLSPDREASVPVQQPPSGMQYTYPSTYSTFARSNSAPASSLASGSNSTCSSDGVPGGLGHPSHLSPALYDPTTGIVYFPQGGAVAATSASSTSSLPSHPQAYAQGQSPSYPTENTLPGIRISDEGLVPDFFMEESAYLNMDTMNNTNFNTSGSGKFDRFELGHPGSAPGSSATTPKQTIKKEKNRGSYRCGRCGKPKVNHVCAFVDATTLSQAVQASGPVLDPASMMPFPGDRVITVNSKRKSIQDTKYESYGMEAARGSSMRQVSRSNSNNSGITQDSLTRSASSAMSDSLGRSNSGSGVIFGSLSRSGDDPSFGVATPRSPSMGIRPTVGFTQPLTQQSQDQKDAAQQLLSSESDDVFFPTAYPPGAGLVLSSRNSSVNSTYGNESDTSSTCGEPVQPRSTLSNMFSADLGLGRFFRF